MDIIEYFADSRKERWREQIARGDWRAAFFLARLIEDINETEKQLGAEPKLYMLTDGDKLIAFATLSEKDCINAPDKYPWIGFVYTYPEYRGKGNSKRLLRHICDEARSRGYKRVWIATGDEGLYEHYGFTYLESRTDIYGETDRVYFKELQEGST